MKRESLENEEYFIIPNPIYDVVFRYLMEDKESAKIVLSTLINEEIIDLDFEPLSHTHKIKSPNSQREITLFHLDFKATVRLPNGEKEVIMIELQKAKLPGDIFRFKRYISKNFQQRSKEEITDPKTGAIKTIDKPIRLIPIFILNFRIENEINDLLIKTHRTKAGVFRNKPLKKENDFIDNLTYDIWVIQLPNLSFISAKDYEEDEYKAKLYALLKLFDQSAQMENRHRLLLIRKIFPGYLERVIRRLKSAASENPELEEKMDMEDDYLKALEDEANKNSLLQQKLDKKEKALKEKEEALKEKDNALKEKNNALKEKDNALKKKDNALKKMVKFLKDKNTPIETIAQMTGLSIKEIEKW